MKTMETRPEALGLKNVVIKRQKALAVEKEHHMETD